VENTVKTAKQLMKKSKEAGTDFYQMDWRNMLSVVLDHPVCRDCVAEDPEHYCQLHHCTREMQLECYQIHMLENG